MFKCFVTVNLAAALPKGEVLSTFQLRPWRFELLLVGLFSYEPTDNDSKNLERCPNLYQLGICAVCHFLPFLALDSFDSEIRLVNISVQIIGEMLQDFFISKLEFIIK